MTTVRLIPSASIQGRTTAAHGGRSYPAGASSAVDVPVQDAPRLAQNGWIQIGSSSGTTSARPTALPNGSRISAGYVYFDTTLGLTIVYDGAAWRDPNTGNAV